jgi:hypothetical protein
MDPDPSIFIIDLQDDNKKLIKKRFFANYFLKALLYHFSKSKRRRAGSGSGSRRAKNVWIRINNTGT